MKLAGAVALVAGLASAAAAAKEAGPVVSVRCTSGALIDGRFGAREWRNAWTRQLPEEARLHLAAADGALYLAVKLAPGSYRYVDLYVRNGAGRLVNFHSSMQQGERELGARWSDSEPPFRWRPPGWASSIARRLPAAPDAPVSRQIARLDGYEMRIPLEVLGPPPYRLRIEVRDFSGEREDWAFPSGSARDDEVLWARLRQVPRCRSRN